MKKNYCIMFSRLQRIWKSKIFKVIKNIIFFIVISISQTFAFDSYAQKKLLNLNFKDESIVNILSEIEKQSDFHFMYDASVVNVNQRKSIVCENNTISKILDRLFQNTGIIYLIDNTQIALRIDNSSLSDNRASQSPERTIKGTVTDTENQPLPGVTVVIKGTTQGTVTDVDGKFSLSIPTGAKTLQFSFVGMKTKDVAVDNRTKFSIVMEEESIGIDEVVAVGYGKQRKVSVVGSIQTIEPQELKVPSSNITNSFAGRLAGVVAFQRSGEPGADGSNFYIRGISTFSGATNPLIILDGVQVSSGDLNALSPEVIESFSILKDATATALYGSRGANGVMIVTTKSGKDMPKPKINIRVENRFSMPTSVPDFVDGPQFMEMYNEAVTGRSTGDIPYSDAKIVGTRQGLDPLLYPNVDWYDELFKPVAINQNANLNVIGGGKKVDYFMNIAATIDNGVLKKFNLNTFDNNIQVQRYSFQNNLNAYLTKDTRISLRLNSQIRDYHGPTVGASSVFGLVMEANPVDFPIMYPQQEGIDHIMFGGKSGGRYNDGYRNPFAEMVKGYSEGFQSTVIATVDGEQKLNFITDGLVFSALASFKNWSNTTTNRSAGYNQYQLNSYDIVDQDSYDLALVGNVQNTTLGTNTGTGGDRSLYLETKLNYNRTFNDCHNVSAMLLYNQSEYMVNNPDGLIASLPKRKQGIASRTTYSYKDKYLAEFNFGYNGSENFAEGKRFGFFPSFALGYVVSNEDYMESISHIVSWLKLRGSWGQVGNDQIGGARFVYLSDVDLTGSGYTTGIDMNYTRSGPVYKRYENKNITWEVGEKLNLGFDLGLFNKFNLVFDIYKEKRDGIFLTRGVIPTSFGTDGTKIYGNLGKVENKGFDFSIDYTKEFYNDFTMQLKGTFTFARNKVIEKDEPLFTKYKNLSSVGHPVNTLWGYKAERLFIDEAEIDNSPTQQIGGTVLPGDIKYTDITNEIDELNLINSDDRIPMGNPTIPEIVYGFGPSFKYKNVDFSFYFQGVAKTSFFINNFHPFGTSNIRNVLQFIADDYWSSESQNIYAAYPRLSKLDHPNNTANSSYWLRDGSFLKLKNIELGYTHKFMRFYATGMNVFTFSKFKLWDPEQGGGNGLKYPTQRVFSIGLQMSL